MKIAVEDLLRGNAVSVCMDEEIAFDQLDDREGAVWSLLLAGGYLKAVGNAWHDDEYGMDRYTLVLTNMEVRQMFGRMVRGWFLDGRAGYNGFEKALLSGSVREMNIYMNKIALSTFSCFDSGKNPSESVEPERFYHGFVLGLIVNLGKRYEITSNRESGYGRYDVMLSPIVGAYDGIILEFMVHDPADERGLQETADAALRQIIQKEYAVSLETKGLTRSRIRIYGFVFRGKEILVDGGCILDYDMRAVQPSVCLAVKNSSLSRLKNES